MERLLSWASVRLLVLCLDDLRKGKRGNTWTHSWVCLSGTAGDAVPDATGRVTLKMAGLGECRFPGDSSSTAQDLCSAPEAQYPKLRGV